MGQLEIPIASIVYVDTAILIYSIERFPDYFPLLEPMWKQLQKSEIRVITSELTLMETLVMPMRNQHKDLIERYEALLLSSEISLIPVSQTILKQAANIRSTTNIRTPDAIHAATALNLGCTIFLTNDSGLRNLPSLPVVILKDLIT
ncbi:putative PilT-like protein [Planktothrix sp. PCC 11201]|uniref:type II toxin-antitoxin system VapC family toxin n=1 Tax=Planktothrix sp. PCC 11201 TaxID=1729650 RepID=UPI00091D0720|nr:PIN domain-containing protein [Planktothrix sp. PCC 11201]SKB13474.1 putative PilT-like protein [Planktothrix sp. PCC 11201]